MNQYMTRGILLICAFSLASGTINAELIFDGGQPDGTTSYYIDHTPGGLYRYTFANDFELSSDDQLTHVRFWTGEDAGAWPWTLTYQIIADESLDAHPWYRPSSTVIGSGTAQDHTHTWNENYRVYENEFTLEAPVDLSSGTRYWLALHASVPTDDRVAWKGTKTWFGTGAHYLLSLGSRFWRYHSDDAHMAFQLISSETNQSPVADADGPYLGAANTAITFNGTGSSDPDGDPLTYEWDFGDEGHGTGDIPTHSYSSAGIYDVCLTVNDGTVDSPTACTIAVVYDVSDGFVTGGGWIDSPVGAYVADTSLTGKANFGFVSKYKKGASVPTGNTAFVFEVAGLEFHSSSYNWLIVNQNGTNAQFKGSGTVNDVGDYKFQLWAGDDDPDTFRIKIWEEDEASDESVIYDNGTDQPIGGGSIVIHAK